MPKAWQHVVTITSQRGNSLLGLRFPYQHSVVVIHNARGSRNLFHNFLSPNEMDGLLVFEFGAGFAAWVFMFPASHLPFKYFQSYVLSIRQWQKGTCTTEFFTPFFSFYRQLVARVNITTCTIISCHITPSEYLNGFLCWGARKTLRCSLRSHSFVPNIVNHWVRKNLYASTEALIHFKFWFADRFVNRFHGRLLVL